MEMQYDDIILYYLQDKYQDKYTRGRKRIEIFYLIHVYVSR